MRKTYSALGLYNYAMKMVDEAESNILDAYSGTSSEPIIRRRYNLKRAYVRQLAREEGVTV